MATTPHRFHTEGLDLFLCHVGLETDLIFNRGIPLPGFAAFPLLETAEGRLILTRYCGDLVEIARAAGAGVHLETPTWMLSRERAAPLGYAPEDVVRLNREAVALVREARVRYGWRATVVSGQVGPRGDPYAAGAGMGPEEAEAYHAEQIGAFAGTRLDIVSAFTIPSSGEGAGIVRAARRFGLPVAVSFTVETDGRLPSGETLAGAIEACDDESGGYAAHYLVNCAHPDHFAPALPAALATGRLRGVVANASRRSHAELDGAETLDAGDPEALGRALRALHRAHPRIDLLGGCCGTDMRHMRAIAGLEAGELAAE
ncbi:homocysteine S-methyltransferase family protein [Jannaschia sp. W003]|uniref:homocysteine S-methyltransferase family protein n=1 Tax=Jannaschia sp. W003 TaxID=2867012 RepID=UPI0021A7D8FC|nr:homocysteine S-methyltransferase family protein [Jannaschia sp. W003]UWQ22304.1 homocysteine S-methyltransferase family protein [Jannaschia sp. W003]